MKPFLRLSGTIAMLVLLSSSSLSLVTGDSAQSTGSDSASFCVSAVEHTYGGLDKPSAIANAEASQAYEQYANTYQNVTYAAILQIDKTTIPFPTCTEEILSYDVVFTSIPSQGLANILLISEVQNLTVVGSELQTTSFSASVQNGIWSGYESSSATSGALVYEATSTFTQPTPSVPSTGCGTTNACNLATWVGLANDSGASDQQLDQAGTMGECTTSPCNDIYFAWIEVLDNDLGAAIECSTTNYGAVTISGGDSIDVIVKNEAINSGGNSGLYDFYIGDGNSGTSCVANGLSKTGNIKNPQFGEFMVENALGCNKEGCGTDEPLAEFSTAYFGGAEIYTGGSLQTINHYLTAGYTMYNKDWTGTAGSCNSKHANNVNYGTLNAYGDFTLTWNSSIYTPYDYTGC